MIEITVDYEDSGATDAYIDVCRKAPEFVEAIASQVAHDLQPLILTDFQQEPGMPSRPIKWTSIRQRRKIGIMASQGLISPRTHALSQGWKFEVIVDTEQATIQLTNPTPETIYVVGIYQQRWHKTTGWYYAPDLGAKWAPVLVEKIAEALANTWHAIPGERRATWK